MNERNLRSSVPESTSRDRLSSCEKATTPGVRAHSSRRAVSPRRRHARARDARRAPRHLDDLHARARRAFRAIRARAPRPCRARLARVVVSRTRRPLLLERLGGLLVRRRGVPDHLPDGPVHRAIHPRPPPRIVDRADADAGRRRGRRRGRPAVGRGRRSNQVHLDAHLRARATPARRLHQAPPPGVQAPRLRPATSLRGSHVQRGAPGAPARPATERRADGTVVVETQESHRRLARFFTKPPRPARSAFTKPRPNPFPRSLPPPFTPPAPSLLPPRTRPRSTATPRALS